MTKAIFSPHAYIFKCFHALIINIVKLHGIQTCEAVEDSAAPLEHLTAILQHYLECLRNMRDFAIYTLKHIYPLINWQITQFDNNPNIIHHWIKPQKILRLQNH